MNLNEQQQLVAEALRGPVLVTAGAGSGKTRTITERLINAVVPGRVSGWEPVALSEVLAVTFTEKAAGELLDRVRTTLRQSDRAGSSAPRGMTGGEWISTVHSLCTRLLRRHAFEAGVDPLFAVADSITAGELGEEAFAAAVHELVADPAVAGLFEIWNLDDVRAACDLVRESCNVAGQAIEDVLVEEPGDIERVVADARDFFAGGVDCFSEYSGTSAAPATCSAACAAALRECDAPDGCGIERIAALLTECKSPSKSLKGVRDVIEEREAQRLGILADVAVVAFAESTQAVIRLASAFDARFREAKAQRGLLDFDDLQILAVGLLEGREDIAQHYRQAFKLVMIDEFQDTDLLQMRLMNALQNDNLCTVGDDKQAIYRFRGAEPEVYRQHRHQMVESGAVPVELSVNYRSHPQILDFVNAVFGSDEYFGDDLMELTTPLTEQDDGSVHVDFVIVGNDECAAPAGRAAQGRVIASRFAELSEEGVRYGDMAVLVRTYKDSHLYARALSDVGIPAVILGGGRFFALPETTIMKALTRAIANPEDSQAIATLITSKACPISDEGIVALRVDAGAERADCSRASLWDLLRRDGDVLGPADAGRAGVLVRAITNARERLGITGLSEVLLRAVEDLGYDLALLSEGNLGVDAFANVLKFARRAARFEANGGAGPVAFLANLADSERFGEHEAPAVVGDDGADFVRIMSIHSSKGLEFPVVAVPELGSCPPSNSCVVRVDRVDGRIRLAMKSGDLAGVALPNSRWFDEMASTENEEDVRERDRTLYVAFTRARDHLIVTGAMKLQPKKASEATTHLRRLADILGVDNPVGGPVDVVVECGGARVHVRALAAEAAPEPGVPDVEALATGLPEIHRCAVQLELPRPKILMPAVMSYSQFRELDACARRFYVQRLLGIREYEVESPDDPIGFGVAMHAVLQLATADGVPEDRFDAVCRHAGLSPDEVRRLREAVSSVLSSQVMRRACEYQSVRREAAFAVALPQGGFRLSGQMDLYCSDGTSALVVDYKSGESKTHDELLVAYRLQAECYALAAFADGADRVEVVFVRPEVLEDGEVQTIVFRFGSAQRGAIESGLSERYQAHEGGDFPASPGDACHACCALPSLCRHARRIV